jgi:hypothetical protein
VAREVAGLDADPARRRERQLLEEAFGEEIAALRHAFPAEYDAIAAQATETERPAESLASPVFDAFIYGEPQPTPLSLEAIRARVDVGWSLVRRWGGHEDGPPAHLHRQHREMVWLLALGCEAPGLLDPLDPQYPERWAEMCETLFDVEIAALKTTCGVD